MESGGQICAFSFDDVDVGDFPSIYLVSHDTDDSDQFCGDSVDVNSAIT